MNRLALFAFFAVMLIGCEKRTPTSEVTFSVSETSQANPAFNIEYTSDRAGGTTIGSNNDNYWTSGKLVLEQGQYASLTVRCTEPIYQMSLSIFVNGNLWKTASLANPTPSASVNGYIPAE